MSTEAPTTFVTQEMIDSKGKFGDEQVSPPISASDIRKWAIAVYWPETPPRIYWDEAYAKTTRYGDIIAPLEFNPFAWPVERFRPDPAAMRAAAASSEAGTRRRRPTTGLNGGQTDTYRAPMRPGDIIKSRTRLLRWEERQGRMGLTLYTYTETEWTNQNGELVRRRISTGIRY